MFDTRPSNNWRYTMKMDVKPSAGLKKRLFDEPESQSTEESARSNLNQLLEEIHKADRLRWNYDFKRDQPLPGGRYKWEPSMTSHKPEHGEGSCCESIGRTSESESDSCLDSPSSSISSPPLKNSLISQSATSPITQRRLLDYFRQKKRPSPSTKGDESRAKKSRTASSNTGCDRPITPRSLFNPISKPDCDE